MDPVIGLWKRHARRHWWGDPLDVRILLCQRLRSMRGKSILDIGTNAGIILNCADDSNQKRGTDIDADLIRLAQRIAEEEGWNARYEVKDMLTDTIAEKYDVIVFANMIEVFPAASRAEILRRLSDSLTPSGVLLLTTPNRGHPHFGPSKLDLEELENALEEWRYELRAWNPFPLWAGHILAWVPGWHAFLGWLSRRSVLKRRCAGFYVEARPKAQATS